MARRSFESVCDELWSLKKDFENFFPLEPQLTQTLMEVLLAMARKILSSKDEVKCFLTKSPVFRNAELVSFLSNFLPEIILSDYRGKLPDISLLTRKEFTPEFIANFMLTNNHAQDKISKAVSEINSNQEMVLNISVEENQLQPGMVFEKEKFDGAIGLASFFVDKDEMDESVLTPLTTVNKVENFDKAGASAKISNFVSEACKTRAPVTETDEHIVTTFESIIITKMPEGALIDSSSDDDIPRILEPRTRSKTSKTDQIKAIQIEPIRLPLNKKRNKTGPKADEYDAPKGILKSLGLSSTKSDKVLQTLTLASKPERNQSTTPQSRNQGRQKSTNLVYKCNLCPTSCSDYMALKLHYKQHA